VTRAAARFRASACQDALRAFTPPRTCGPTLPLQGRVVSAAILDSIGAPD
jgi:hypothetical protein